MKLLFWIAGVVLALGAAGYAAFHLSPWPGAIVVRWFFERGAARVLASQAKHVPKDISALLDLRYDAADPDAHLDVYRPGTGDKPLPTVVWVHGGGFVSGSKDELANYARILAGKGHTVAVVDYSIAPARHYPLPVRQVNAALAFLQKDARRLGVDPARFFLAGDSAGAHIALQLAVAIGTPAYAQALGLSPAVGRGQLAGLILYCGPYDLGLIEGPPGIFLEAMIWSYSGRRDFKQDPQFATFNVLNYVTRDLPPLFVSAGNADFLLPHSIALAELARRQGVPVDSLFFDKDRTPALGHEYQFDLDAEAGRLALERSVGFIAARASAAAASRAPR